jgi:hypothetical protein
MELQIAGGTRRRRRDAVRVEGWSYAGIFKIVPLYIPGIDFSEIAIAKNEPHTHTRVLFMSEILRNTLQTKKAMKIVCPKFILNPNFIKVKATSVRCGSEF